MEESREVHAQLAAKVGYDKHGRLESNGCQIEIGYEVSSISKSNGGKSIVSYI
jgi:hypothetical protein